MCFIQFILCLFFWCGGWGRFGSSSVLPSFLSLSAFSDTRANEPKSQKPKNAKQEWYRQTPHYTYVTRARTTRPPTAPTRPFVWSTTTTTTTASSPTTVARPDEGDEDDYLESSTSTSWSDLIDPVPTFWPTSNWWGSIDPIRNHNDPPGQRQREQHRDSSSHHSNRIPTYSPTNNNYAGGGNNKNRGAAGSGGGGNHARSSSSRPAPYFQLLLAGLVQVRSFSSRLLLVVVVAAASLFQILKA